VTHAIPTTGGFVLERPGLAGHREDVAPSTDPSQWSPFECDSRAFEFTVIASKDKTRPAGWPSHKPSRGPGVPIVLLVVRKPGNETGPGMVYPEGTVITTEHAIETARLFWADLTR
jgi:hypothetical protein